MDKRKINEKFSKKKSMTHFCERNDEKPCWRSQKPLGIPDKRVRNVLIFAWKFWSIVVDARRSFWLTDLYWFVVSWEKIISTCGLRTFMSSFFLFCKEDVNCEWIYKVSRFKQIFMEFRKNILRLNDKHMCASSISWFLFLFFRCVLLLRVSLF